MWSVALGLVAGWLLVVPGGAAADVLDPEQGGTFGVVIALSRAAFSPNGDGRADELGIRLELSEPATASLRVLGRHGSASPLLDGVPLAAGTTEVRWAGLDEDGAALPDGTYTVRLDAVGPVGDVGSAEALAIVDTRPPAFAWQPISPEPYRGAGSVRFGFLVRDRSARVTVRGRIVGADGHRVTTLPARSVATGTRRLVWDGTTRGGRAADAGRMEVRITVRDDAGNARTSRARPFRDHRPAAPRIVRRVEGADGRVALTFDDCSDGSAWTRILDVLASRRVGASFFCLGPAVLAHPDVARRAAAGGHTIGGHGWDHASLRTLSGPQIAERVRREESAWWRVARTTPVPFFRPPYGEVNDAAAAALGREGFANVVLWDVDPWDWTDPGSAAVTARVLAHARSGSIVVLHVRPGTAAALPGLIDGLRARGLEPVTLLELMAARRP